MSIAQSCTGYAVLDMMFFMRLKWNREWTTTLSWSEQTSGKLLVTEDKDFGELVYRQRLVHAGVILVRLAGLSPSTKADAVVRALEEHGPELAGAFSVIAPGNLRVRRTLR